MNIPAGYFGKTSDGDRGSGARPHRGSGTRSRPDALLYVLATVIFCYVWRVQDLFPILGSLQIPLLSAGLAVGLFILDEHPRRSITDLESPIPALLFCLASIMVVGAPFALVQGTTFTFFVRDFVPSIVLLAGLTAAAVRSEEDVRWLACVHVAGAFVFCLIILTRYTVGSGGRLGELVYYDANDLGMLLVMTFPLALFFLLRGRRTLTKLMAGAAMLLFIATIVKTGSRGAFVGFCVIGAWILVRYTSISVPKRLAVLATAVLLLGTWGSSDYWDRMRTLLSPTEDYNWAGESESGRMEVWQRGVGYMLDRPLVGVGARNFSAAEGYLSRGGQRNQLGGEGFKWSAAHNSFVEIGAETGIVGLALFIALLLQGFRIAGRSPPTSSGRDSRQDSKAMRQALRVSLIGFVVTGFFLSAAYDPILYALLGILAGLRKLDVGARRRAGVREPRERLRVVNTRQRDVRSSNPQRAS